MGRRYKKYPPPELNQGWDTKYSTVPPWLRSTTVTHWHDNGCIRPAISDRQLRSGINPGRGTGTSHQTAPSLRIFPGMHVFITAFYLKNLAYFLHLVNPGMPEKILSEKKKYRRNRTAGFHNGILQKANSAPAFDRMCQCAGRYVVAKKKLPTKYGFLVDIICSLLFNKVCRNPVLFEFR